MPEVEVSVSPGPKDANLSPLVDELGLGHLLAKILYIRGYKDSEAAQSFLEPSLSESLPDPSNVLNLDLACDMIISALLEKKKVGIVSDFDVDGTTACAQLSGFFDSIGVKHHIFIPDRITDGYGLNCDAVRAMNEKGVSLLMTLDCGISSFDEILLASELGMKSIILDHHQLPPKLPPADAIVNPANKDCPFNEFELCASGLVWILLIRLRSKLSEVLEKDKSKIADLKEYLDLAAIGTICDMVPLKKLNRLIAKKGVEQLKRSSRLGLQAMMDSAGIFPPKLSSGSVGWVLGPRINAAGRIDNASQVVQLFQTKDQKFAESVAGKLETLNKTRKQVESNMLAVALEKLDDLSESSAICIFDESYHLGVIGIVAARIVERTYKPAVIMAPSPEDSEVVKGSIRSVKGFDVSQTLKALAPLLINGGGHAMAGGFSLKRENLEPFVVSFCELAKEVSPTRVLSVDMKVKFSDLNYLAVKELDKLEPFGIGNSRPSFFTEAVRVKTFREVGDNHLKLELTDGTASLTAMFWRAADRVNVRVGDTFNIVYSPELNNFRGVETVQLQLKEIVFNE